MDNFFLLEKLELHVLPLKKYQVILLSRLHYEGAKILRIRCGTYSIDIWRLREECK